MVKSYKNIILMILTVMTFFAVIVVFADYAAQHEQDRHGLCGRADRVSYVGDYEAKPTKEIKVSLSKKMTEFYLLYFGHPFISFCLAVIYWLLFTNNKVKIRFPDLRFKINVLLLHCAFIYMILHANVKASHFGFSNYQLIPTITYLCLLSTLFLWELYIFRRIFRKQLYIVSAGLSNFRTKSFNFLLTELDSFRSRWLNKKYLKVFWPFLTCLFLFLTYKLVLINYNSQLPNLILLRFYAPGYIVCSLLMPLIAIIQLAYGLYKMIKTKDRHFTLHLYSVFACFVLIITFN